VATLERMFSVIVVGTDGSDTAAEAVSLAFELARQNDATLHLVSAFRDPASSMAVASAGATAVADPSVTKAVLEDVSKRVLEEASALGEGVQVRTHAVSGPAADVILRVAEEVGADVVVVGSKGMRGAKRLIGSVPNTVAHRAPCHVLIAKTA